MINLKIGDTFLVGTAPDKKMLRGTIWKIVKHDLKTKHYELRNVEPKTGNEIKGRVAVSFEMKEIELMLKKGNFKSVHIV